MILNKLILQGTLYRRTIEFNNDLTIISGETTSGKSLVLRLIDYCLGKSGKIDFNVQTELGDKCDQIFLEIKIKDEIITFNRFLKEKQNKIRVYFCEYNQIDKYTPKIVELREAMKILMNKLEINEYQLIRKKRNSSNKQIETVSFRDIFRFVYINQHELGTHDFLSKKDVFKARKNAHAFKMIFNLTNENGEAAKRRIVDIQNEILEKKKEIYGLQSYLTDLGITDYVVNNLKIDKKYKEIQDLNSQKKEILERTTEKTNSNHENKMYIKLKDDLTGITNDVFEIKNQIKSLMLSIESKKFLIEDYKAELLEVEETIELNYKLTIPEQGVECPLCASKVSSTFQEDDSAETVLTKIKKQLLNKIKLVESLIDKENKLIVHHNDELSVLLEKQSILSEAIHQYSQKTDVPYLSQINSINVQINKLIKTQEELKEGLKLYNKIEEKRKLILDLELEEKRLNDEITDSKSRESEEIKIFEYINKEYKAFMKRLKYEVDSTTYIHNTEMVPYYNGSSVYSHDSGGLLECMQIAFLAAILKSKKSGFAVGHPGILMLDSISKYVGTLQNEDQSENKIKDPEVYEEFYKILSELSKDNQIILVENTPLEIYSDLYTKYTFLKGARGLIDDSANEISLDQ